MRTFLWLALALAPLAARAEPLQDPRPFNQAFALSFFRFDACGDEKYGALFRRALNLRFSKCPFSPEARAAYYHKISLQAEWSRKRLEAMTEENGGKPMRLPGAEETCRQQLAEPDYVAFRAKLESVSVGTAKLEDVLTFPCDADPITP